MLRLLKVSAAACALSGFMLMGLQPAEASCQLVKATASSTSKAQAAKDSQALAVESAHEVKRAKGWGYMNMSARRVKGDPFWKAVRPGDPPPDALLKPDIVTSRFFTTCFTGVVVPVVCTTGSAVCGN